MRDFKWDYLDLKLTVIKTQKTGNILLAVGPIIYVY